MRLLAGDVQVFVTRREMTSDGHKISSSDVKGVMTVSALKPVWKISGMHGGAVV